MRRNRCKKITQFGKKKITIFSLKKLINFNQFSNHFHYGFPLDATLTIHRWFSIADYGHIPSTNQHPLRSTLFHADIKSGTYIVHAAYQILCPAMRKPRSNSSLRRLFDVFATCDRFASVCCRSCNSLKTIYRIGRQRGDEFFSFSPIWKMLPQRYADVALISSRK